MHVLNEHGGCIGLLLDMICYEIHGERLSPEMEGLLEDHLNSCAECRLKVYQFQEVALPAKQVSYRH